jgi:uncharacterized protein (DUF2267 family)
LPVKEEIIMQYHEFIGQVQQRAQLPGTGQAVHAIHATLETLGERLTGGEANDLASQLPTEIGHYLHLGKVQEKYGMDEFFDRVSEREGVELGTAMHHARVVMSVLTEAVSSGEIEDARAQLPEELKWLFTIGYDDRGYEERGAA